MTSVSQSTFERKLCLAVRRVLRCSTAMPLYEIELDRISKGTHAQPLYRRGGPLVPEMEGNEMLALCIRHLMHHAQHLYGRLPTTFLDILNTPCEFASGRMKGRALTWITRTILEDKRRLIFGANACGRPGEYEVIRI